MVLNSHGPCGPREVHPEGPTLTGEGLFVFLNRAPSIRLRSAFLGLSCHVLIVGHRLAPFSHSAFLSAACSGPHRESSSCHPCHDEYEVSALRRAVEARPTGPASRAEPAQGGALLPHEPRAQTLALRSTPLSGSPSTHCRTRCSLCCLALPHALCWMTQGPPHGLPALPSGCAVFHTVTEGCSQAIPFCPGRALGTPVPTGFTHTDLKSFLAL